MFGRVFVAGRRHFSSQQNSARRMLLEAIYFPAFEKLQKGSPEYIALSRSGKVWETFFKPQNIKPYLAAQAKLQKTLKLVDKLKLSFSDRTDLKTTIPRALVIEYAHQSTAIEGNPLRISDSLAIEDELEKQFFHSISALANMSPQSVANLTLPNSDALLPRKDSAQVAELRNHILVSRYLTENGLANPGTVGISLADIKQISRIMLMGTAAEDLYRYEWGKRTDLGEFRSAPITV